MKVISGNFVDLRAKKKPLCWQKGLNGKEPGDNRLLHGRNPHYHRRQMVSLLSSRWNQVGPTGYGHQATGTGVPYPSPFKDCGYLLTHCCYVLTVLSTQDNWLFKGRMIKGICNA